MSYIIVVVFITIAVIVLRFLAKSLLRHSQKRNSKSFNGFATYISETSQLSDHLK